MQLSITTDYARDTGNPEPYLRQIAETGFTHIHWCHHWNTDFLYSSFEVEQIGRWLHDLGLQLLDLHATDGREKVWSSLREYERQAGVELVKNRIEMTAQLGGDAIVMHVPNLLDATTRDQTWSQLLKSLDELQPYARDRNIRIAMENGTDDSVVHMRKLFEQYGPEYLGLCYDCGHGNLTGKGLDQLESLKDRLAVVHLHDNNGNADQHKIPFTGTVDWQRLAEIMARSAYKKCVSMESNMHQHDIRDERAWLQQAYEAGARLTHMIEDVMPS
jgi:sugar phosphate isomerase/epimerase